MKLENRLRQLERAAEQNEIQRLADGYREYWPGTPHEEALRQARAFYVADTEAPWVDRGNGIADIAPWIICLARELGRDPDEMVAEAEQTIKENGWNRPDIDTRTS